MADARHDFGTNYLETLHNISALRTPSPYVNLTKLPHKKVSNVYETKISSQHS